MKNILLTVALFCAISCFARIGENSDQCANRYSEDKRGEDLGGAFVSVIKYSYTKSGITTICTFYDSAASAETDNSPLSQRDLKAKDLNTDSGPMKTAQDRKNERRHSIDASPYICYKINFREKDSKENAEIQKSIPELLKANAGILSWKETEKGARWECVNKKFIATFAPRKGLTIIDTSCPAYKEAEAKKAAKAEAETPEGKAKAIKSF